MNILFDGCGYIAGVFSSEERMLQAKERYLLNSTDKQRRKGNRYTYGDSLSLTLDFLWSMSIREKDMYKVVQTYDLDCVVAIEKMTPSVCLHAYEDPVIGEHSDVVVVYNIWANGPHMAYKIAEDITQVTGIRYGFRVYKGAK